MATRPVTAGLKSLKALQTTLDRSTQDGQVTTKEKQAVAKATRDAYLSTQKLVAPVALKADATLKAVRQATGKNQLVEKGEALEQQVFQTRKDVNAANREVRQSSGFRKLKGKWKTPLGGVRQKSVKLKNGVRVRMLAVDLNSASLQLNPEKARGKTPRAQAERAKAEIAVNGAFFDPYGNFRSNGYTVTNNKRWRSGPKKRDSSAMIAFRGSRAQIVGPGQKVPSWANNVLSGRQQPLRDGKLKIVPDLYKTAPRVAVGLSKDGRTLYLMAADGQYDMGRGWTTGTNQKQLAKLLRTHGAHDVMMMDGGSSTQMYLKGQGNLTPFQRAVASTLLVQTR